MAEDYQNFVYIN